MLNANDANRRLADLNKLSFPDNTMPTSELDIFGSLEGSEEMSFSVLQTKLMGAWAAVVLLCGTLLNVLTLVALARPANPRIKNPTLRFVISLTCADLGFCFGVLPFKVLSYLFNLDFEEGIICSMVPFLRYFTSATPLMSLMLISINRYLNIAQRSVYARVYQPHWIVVMISGAWLTCLASLMPTLFGIWGRFAYDTRLGACSIIKDKNGRSSKLTLLIIGFLVPLIIIIACYACILYMTYRWNQHARKSGLLTKRKERNQEQRVTIMTATLTVSYIVCYCPLTLAKCLDKAILWPSFHALGYCFWYAEAAVNPILYVLLNNQYRKEFERVAKRTLFCFRWPLGWRRGQMNITPADLTQHAGLGAKREASQETCNEKKRDTSYESY